MLKPYYKTPKNDKPKLPLPHYSQANMINRLLNTNLRHNVCNPKDKERSVLDWKGSVSKIVQGSIFRVIPTYDI